MRGECTELQDLWGRNQKKHSRFTILIVQYYCTKLLIINSLKAPLDEVFIDDSLNLTKGAYYACFPFFEIFSHKICIKPNIVQFFGISIFFVFFLKITYIKFCI